MILMQFVVPLQLISRCLNILDAICSITVGNISQPLGE